MPGPEALNTPGKSDGQLVMINESGKPICYKWLSNECKWDKVGDILSAADPNKNMHDGKVIQHLFFFLIILNYSILYFIGV